ncbi:MAG TPA: aminotransferase class V-fold PLP-dependent enzyme [Thermoanaerobaculia bacterium]|nr:aminotransferase class V-fold PLP-dependent enzyme [Thermoanaerobaculia bacterium]
MHTAPHAVERALPQRLVGQDKRELLTDLLVAKQRRCFPALEQKKYFNYGAQGPLPAVAREAILRFYQELDTAAPMSVAAQVAAADELHRCRAAIVSEFAAGEPERLALLDNTSTGCNVVLWGLRWGNGDRILLGDHEYPGVVAAVHECARRHGLKVDLLATDLDPARLLDQLAGQLLPDTRLVVVSHVLWDTGRVLPIAEIAGLCRGQDRARLLVDGAQAAGAMPLSLAALGADYYAFPGHKWCCGPEGVGALYVAPEAFEDLDPTFIGPRSLLYDPATGAPAGFRRDARRFETSTSPVALFAGLRAALELHGRWGDREARWRRIRSLGDLLWQRLGELPPALFERLQTDRPEAGLVFFRLRGREQEQGSLVRFLEGRGILIRTMPHLRCLRASVHYLTLASDVEALLDGLGGFPTNP